MIKIAKLRAGFYILAAALLLSIAAFVVYNLTFDAFHYVTDRWIVALMIIVIWSIVCLLISSLFMGDKPLYIDALYIIAMFALVIAFIKFLTPCLSPIGIYFTVHNMGDVEANAIGVPRSIVGIVIYVLAIICLVVGAFFGRSKNEEPRYIFVKDIVKELYKLNKKMDSVMAGVHIDVHPDPIPAAPDSKESDAEQIMYARALYNRLADTASAVHESYAKYNIDAPAIQSLYRLVNEADKIICQLDDVAANVNADNSETGGEHEGYGI